MHGKLNRSLLAIALDNLCLIAAVFAAAWLRIAIPVGKYLPEVTQEIPLLIAALLIYPPVFLLLYLYDPDRVLQEWDEVWGLVTACALAGLALAGLIYFTFRDISRLLLIYFFSIHLLLVATWRILARLLTKKIVSRSIRRVLLVGDGQLASRVFEGMSDLPNHELDFVGFIHEQASQASRVFGLPCLGGLEHAADVVNDNKIDDVFIALDDESQALVQQLVGSLVETSCSIWLVPDYYSLLVYGGKVHNWGGLSFISLKAPTLTGYQRLIKRIFDLIIGTVLFVISIPLLGLAAGLIWLDSPGGVMLRQERVGENRRLFLMYKFRTMFVGSEDYAGEGMRIGVHDQGVHKTPNDPRVTRVGHFLRRASIDELPQLWNVLKGEMSLVGPRPELPTLVARYEPWQQKRFAVPQGMTGWWQVNGRSDRPMHLHTEDDLFYVQHYSLWLDIQILLKTLWVVIRGKGAF